jgi:hypothetical protein
MMKVGSLRANPDVLYIHKMTNISHCSRMKSLLHKRLDPEELVPHNHWVISVFEEFDLS